VTLDVLGLVSIDTLAFYDNNSYVGGGGLATAWIASLWDLSTTLHSVSCNKKCFDIIENNTYSNKKFFTHIPMYISSIMTTIIIQQYIKEAEYQYTINNLTNAETNLRHFLQKDLENKYIKLPASYFGNCNNSYGFISVNPQGYFNLQQFVADTNINGFIFLNYRELLSCSNMQFSDTLHYIERSKKSFVITLGKFGAICYCREKNHWWYCPSIVSRNCRGTLGCGDAFAGGFLSAYIQQSSIGICLAKGTVSAYYATKSPNNMVINWFIEKPVQVIETVNAKIRCFESAQEVLQYLQSDSEHFSVCDSDLSFDENLSFQWKYN